MDEVEKPEEEEEFAPLPDVRDKDIIEIGEGTVDRAALERLLEGLDQSGNIISAFQNLIEPKDEPPVT